VLMLGSSSFIYVCARCGKRYHYEWRRGYAWFPAHRVLEDGHHFYWRCPYCGSYRIHAVCPRCGHRFPLTRGLGTPSGRGGLPSLAVDCPRCRHREYLEHFMPGARIHNHVAREAGGGA